MKILSNLLPGIVFGICILTFPVCAQADLPDEFDSYFRAVQEQFDVPGIAVSIVKNGKVVLKKGYGVKKNDFGAAVDDKTLFGIASNTKAFTAIALAQLVEDGKLEWDKPIVHYVSWLRLSDSIAAKEFSIRDLLAHRSGLGYGAGNLLLWPNTTYTRKQIVRRIRFIPPASDFRSAYGYSNLLYAAAGELIESVSGLSWEEFITERILKKVGMANSSIKGARSSFKNLNDNPAGGINSSAEDMAKWMICLLDSGKINGNSSLYTFSTARELWTPVTPILVKEEDPELWPSKPNRRDYALGFIVKDYRGKKLVGHTGTLNGFVSRIAMIPEMKLGVTVLTNSTSSEAYDAIVNRVLDFYLNAPEFDWINAYQRVKARTDSAITIEEGKIWAHRPSSSNPTLPIAKYARIYKDKWYGNITVRIKKNKKLEIRFDHSPSLYGTLEHYQNDTFIIRWKQYARRSSAFITFVLDQNGAIDYAAIKSILPSANRAMDFQDLFLRPVKKVK
jgi:CubicO group peptidase (beta-lactamase class C family)